MTAPPLLPTGTVRGVVLDLDGTLIDGYGAIAAGVNAARAAYALPPLTVDDVRGRVGLGLSHLMEDVLGPERAVPGAEIFREVYAGVCEEQTRPVAGLAETMNELRRRGFRLSVASNKPAMYSTRILGRLGVLGCFDAIEGPETAGAAKPDPAMILTCLRAMKVRPGQALYVGDMTIDVDAGGRAGVPVVLVSGGSCSDELLRGTGRPVLPRLSALLDLLPGVAPPLT